MHITGLSPEILKASNRWCAARGKATIISLCKILNQFGAPYSVLHDSDAAQTLHPAALPRTGHRQNRRHRGRVLPQRLHPGRKVHRPLGVLGPGQRHSRRHGRGKDPGGDGLPTADRFDLHHRPHDSANPHANAGTRRSRGRGQRVGGVLAGARALPATQSRNEETAEDEDENCKRKIQPGARAFGRPRPSSSAVSGKRSEGAKASAPHRNFGRCGSTSAGTIFEMSPPWRAIWRIKPEDRNHPRTHD